MVNQRLYRILTDGKIFSYREKRKKTGRNFEFCILVDQSGSMDGSKIKEAMMAAFTAWESLVSARVPVCLMTHTTVSDSGVLREHPIIRIVADHDEHRVDTVQRRASYISRNDYSEMRNNYDGFAVNAAVEHGFTRTPDRKRYLFVISDGEPAGSVYHGRQAIDHTHQQVEIARDKGIDVVSITVSAGAYAVNDKIYGARKNVKASNPAVLDDLIEAMFVRH
jgi:nitric oxide reductase activation protein